MAQPRRRRRRASPAESRLIVALLTAGAAAGGALAGCHPTATPWVDPTYGALFAALVTVAASRASRSTLLVLAGVAAGLSRGWLLVPGTAALLVAFASVFPHRARRRVGALTGALAIQVVVRWPTVGFHGLTALVAAAIVVPCLVSAFLHSSGRARRWVLRTTLGAAVALAVCTVPVVVGALLAHPPIRQGIDATEGALTSVTDGSSQPAAQQLEVAGADFSVASERIGSWWTAGGLLVPVLAEQRRAIAAATETGRGVTTTAAAVSASIDLDDLGYSHGRVDLGRIERLGAPIDRLDASLTAAQAQLAGIRSGWLVEPVQTDLTRFGGKLATARSGAGTAAMAVRAAPGILGGDGVRHYLIAFMNTSESRSLDGFIGAYGELTVLDGRIDLTRAGPVAQLDRAAPDGTRHIRGPADYLARYGAFHPANYFEDLSFSPDFPTVEDVIAQMYPQSGGDHIDGVLALDPDGLASLLAITGPVTVPGLRTPLTAGNAATFLLKGQYELFGNANSSRHDFLQEALSEAFHHLVAGRLPAPETVARQLDPEVREGRILFWTDKPGEQPLLRRLGLAGGFPRVAGRDLLAVTTQDARSNKLDAYLHRSIDDRVVFDPSTGQTRSTVTITIRNSAPAAGLPNVVLGDPGGSLARGTDRSWLSVYSPLQLTGASEDGVPLSLSSEPELGVNTFSAYIVVPSGRAVTVEVDLAGRLQPGPTYALTVWNQPMVNADHLASQVRATAGWSTIRSSGAPWEPATRQRQSNITLFGRF